MTRAPLSEINVTPMVDVMLVLLTIFMVAGPMLDQGIAVALPKAGSGRELGGEGLSITLTKEHVIYVNGQLVTLQELRRTLRGLGRGRPILIRSDRNAYVSKLVELWDACRDAGLTEIRIATVTE